MLLDLAVAQLGDLGGPAYGNLVSAFEPMHDHGSRTAEIPEHSRNHLHHFAAVNTDQLMRRHRGIGQWAQDVEDRANADFTSGLDRVFHGFVEQRREKKSDADIRNALFHALLPG